MAKRFVPVFKLYRTEMRVLPYARTSIIKVPTCYIAGSLLYILIDINLERTENVNQKKVI